jgi:hypothetical protein
LILGGVLGLHRRGGLLYLVLLGPRETVDVDMRLLEIKMMKEKEKKEEEEEERKKKSLQ